MRKLFRPSSINLLRVIQVLVHVHITELVMEVDAVNVVHTQEVVAITPYVSLVRIKFIRRSSLHVGVKIIERVRRTIRRVLSCNEYGEQTKQEEN